ncbi:rhomboid family intramembrane serine protease [Citricoccus sp. SGAir0253]|uniref:rhomboid family intramembrane serine protease n=1 Tax=Citricoccus sp. SGAir0253 TaxID=2567881 RepID=UPI0010CD14FB|nr:rhomboid family intramembrane serine protease [Citricoccus sp. SGAir0253]QCU78658.1 rhomboid family intramembrane serine protease [Citricoccus sp. SGAir0253]
MPGPVDPPRTPSVVETYRSQPGWIRRAVPIAGLVALMWVLEVLDLFAGGWLNQFGIRPLDPDALTGILVAPLLHAGLGHLASNTLPLLVLGTLIAWITGRWWIITAGVWLLGGLLTWLVGGPGTNHIGASIVVYGYAAFLVTYGILSRRLAAILAAVATVLLYGGFVWGFLPLNPRVSWEGHLAGAAAGVVVAFADTGQARRDRRLRALGRRDGLV